MSERVATKAQPAPAIRQARTGDVLRRKCSCGAHTIAGGECGSCRTKHAGRLQRSAFGRADAIEAPSIVHDVLRSPGCPLDALTRSFMEPRFDHDFSRVRATSPRNRNRTARRPLRAGGRPILTEVDARAEDRRARRRGTRSTS